MTNSAYLTQIRNAIAQNDLAAALQQLRRLLDNSPQLDEALLQNARFEAIRQQIRQGTVSAAEGALTQNQIRAGLLDLLREIESKAGDSPAADTPPSDAKALREEMQRVLSIVNSKNVVAGSTISAGGDVVIGDTNKTVVQNAEKIYNIKHIDNADFS